MFKFVSFWYVFGIQLICKENVGIGKPNFGGLIIIYLDSEAKLREVKIIEK